MIGTIIGIVIGVAGVALALWFGVRSMFQAQDVEALEKAVRGLCQGMFNNIWRMGSNAESALKVPSEAGSRELVRGIADMSQTARQVLIAFGREHLQCVPFKEEAWEARELPPQPVDKKFWRRFFRV